MVKSCVKISPYISTDIAQSWSPGQNIIFSDNTLNTLWISASKSGILEADRHRVFYVLLLNVMFCPVYQE